MDPCQCNGLLEMIRSGELPSSTNLALIQAEIAKMRQIASNIRKLLPIHEAAVAPVRRLPEDVLLRVFSYLERQASVDSGRALVGRVCKFWRKVSRSSPTLWSSLYVFFPLPQEVPAPNPFAGRPAALHNNANRTFDGLPAKVAFLPQTLLLSKALPLDIQMAFGGSRTPSIVVSRDSLVKKIMHILSGQDYRIRALEFYLPPGTPMPLLSEFNFQALETFTVCSATFVGTSLDSVDPDTVFPSTLRHLHLDGIMLPSSYCVQWSSLHYLQASFPSIAMCYQTLSASLNLAELIIPHISREDAADEGAAPIRQSAITLPSLHTLKLGHSSFALFPRQVRLPMLASVHFGLEWSHHTDPAFRLPELHNMALGWGCNALKTWSYIGASPMDAFLPPFIGMGDSITKLDMCLYLIERSIIDPSGVQSCWNGAKNFFDALSNDSRSCLPSLVDLILRVDIEDEDVYFSQGTVASKMLRARKLRLSLNLESHEEAGTRDTDMMKAITSPLARAMRELGQEGVTCAWFFDGQDVLARSSDLADGLE